MENKHNYLINDPSTPDLTQEVDLPREITGRLAYKIFINQLNENNLYRKNNIQVTLSNGINKFLGMSNVFVKSWAGTRRLMIHPNAGYNYNAYYDRRSLSFFVGKSKNQPILYTSDSQDIVAHELGHALLDAIRPDLWNTVSLEVWSFHETFADAYAIFSILQYEATRELFIKQTKDNIRNKNIASSLAEEFGILLHKMSNGQNGSLSHSLRDATVKFKYKDPLLLPKEGKNNQLIAECHSFGRVFLSAWYEYFILLFELRSKNKINKEEILLKTIDEAYFDLVSAATKAPRQILFLGSVAKTMLRQIQDNQEKHDILHKVFLDWKIVRPKVKIFNKLTLDQVIDQLDDTKLKIKEEGDLKSIVVDNGREIKLSSYIDSGDISSLSNDLANYKLDVPSDDAYYFNSNNELIGIEKSDFMSIIQSSKFCIDYINRKDLLGDKNYWNIEEDKIIRNKIA